MAQPGYTTTTRVYYSYVRDPSTGQLKPKRFTQEVQVPSTAARMQEAKNIAQAYQTGQNVKATDPFTGKTKTYTPSQGQAIVGQKEAIKAGADPRQFTSPGSSGVGNLSYNQAALLGQINIAGGSTDLSAGLPERIKSEIRTQEQLAPIRQRRQSMLEQQVKAMRRQTGRRALLSSPTGGAGFFGGYFK